MTDEDVAPGHEPDTAPRRRVRMPIEDRVPPESWSAEHPDGDDVEPDVQAAHQAERLRSTPWGYR